jgi:diguanylate cyclase
VFTDDDFFDDDEGTDDALLTHQSLIDTQERLGALLDLMPTGLVIHQKQGVLYANQQALRLFQQSKDKLIGQHILDYVQDDVRAVCGELFHSAFDGDAPVRLPEFSIQHDDANIFHIRATAARLPWDGTPVIQILMEDVSELKRQAEALRKLTYWDDLTDTYNRRYFIKTAETIIENARSQNIPFSLMIFDVDWFKKVNDTFGHLAGDEVLKSIGKIWQDNTRQKEESLRENDGTLARIGGEEFSILLPHTDLKKACVVAERIRKAFESREIRYDKHVIKVTASFGVTSLQPIDTKLDDLIRRADNALYKAKDQGRNRICSE